MDVLEQRGWKKLDLGADEHTVPRCEMWRQGWIPFCIELEVWETGNIRGRLSAPGLNVYGTMTFEFEQDIDTVASFLERLLEGATNALLPPTTNVSDDGVSNDR